MNQNNYLTLKKSVFMTTSIAVAIIAFFLIFAAKTVLTIRVLCANIIELSYLESLGFNRDKELEEQFKLIHYQVFLLFIYTIIILLSILFIIWKPLKFWV